VREIFQEVLEMRRAMCLSLVLGLLAGPLHAAGVPSTDDPEVKKGVVQVNEGQYDAAIFTLDAAARRLAASNDNPQQLSQAYLYLGIAYLAKGRESAAEARFRDALDQMHSLQLPPDKFAQRIVDVFEKARATRAATGGGAAPSQNMEPHYGSAKTFAVAGGAVAATGLVLLFTGDKENNAFGQIYQSRFTGLEAGTTQFFDIPVRGSGSLTVTVDWQSARSVVDVSLTCLGDPLTCSGTLAHASRGGKPGALVATVTPGTYRLMVSLAGHDDVAEAGSIQAVLTR
jgi:hypothetical protein